MERSVMVDKIRTLRLIEQGLFASEIVLLDEKDSMFLYKQLSLHTAAKRLAELISSSRNTCFTIVNSTKDVEMSINTGKTISKKIKIQIDLTQKQCYTVLS